MHQPGSERSKARNPVADDLNFMVCRILCGSLEIFKHNYFSIQSMYRPSRGNTSIVKLC